MEIADLPTEFEWDRHNTSHVCIHKVEPWECEQVFFNVPLIVKSDLAHSGIEERYFALGKTDMNRILLIVFTIRKTKIRVITARDANRKERRRYET